jgi:hypothetical protein
MPSLVPAQIYAHQTPAGMSLYFSNDHPTASESVEREITRLRGSLAPQAAIQGNAHVSMCGPTPSLSQMIKQTELENERL